jgi:hypothetical protein
MVKNIPLLLLYIVMLFCWFTMLFIGTVVIVICDMVGNKAEPIHDFVNIVCTGEWVNTIHNKLFKN